MYCIFLCDKKHSFKLLKKSLKNSLSYHHMIRESTCISWSTQKLFNKLLKSLLRDLNDLIAMQREKSTRLFFFPCLAISSSALLAESSSLVTASSICCLCLSLFHSLWRLVLLQTDHLSRYFFFFCLLKSFQNI